jgi:nucleoside-diphosphate-sugar epimerase
MGHRLPGFPLTPSRVDALTGRARFSIDRIRHELGFVPRIAAAEGLSRFIHTMRKGAMRTHE